MILVDNDTAEAHMKAGVFGRTTLHRLLSWHAEKHPEKVALVDPVNRAEWTDGAPWRLTYGEVERAVNNLTARFISLGLKSDHIIAIQMGNTVEAVISILASLKAGLIVCPIPLSWRDSELREALASLTPRALLTTARMNGHEYADHMRYTAADVFSVRYVLAFGENLPDGVMGLDEGLFDEPQQVAFPARDGNGADHVATIQWTHATTNEGDVKLCPLTRSHNQWVAAGLPYLIESRLSANDVIINPFMLTSFTGFALGLVPWLLSGSTLILHQPFEENSFFEQLAEEHATHILLPAAAFKAISPSLSGMPDIKAVGVLAREVSDRDFASYDLPVIDILNAGEMAFITQKRQSTLAEVMPVGWVRAPFASEEGPVVLQAALEGGRLRVKGPMVSTAAYPLADKTGERIAFMPIDSEGFVRTGVTIYEDDTATPINNDLARIGGLHVTLSELDTIYARYDGALDAAAFTVPDPVLGERLQVAMVPNPATPVSTEAFTTYLRGRRIANYKIPDRVIAVRNLPRNDNGQIDRSRILAEI